MDPVTVTRGDRPLILAMPHGGLDVPADLFARLNDNGRRLADADWHIARLYAGLIDGATIVSANFHRYVIDANRDPQGVSLYPGQNTTGLVPLTDFDGLPIWRAGAEPDAAEIETRRLAFHAPYHAALSAEVERLRARHGAVVVYDCHSIRSAIPFLFEGRLPDFNIGTFEGKSCDPALATTTLSAVRAAQGYSHVLNGRFKGGWTTRHYGQPARQVHAIQMELSQSTYLASEQEPFAYDEVKADRLRPVLANLLAALLATLSDRPTSKVTA